MKFLVYLSFLLSLNSFATDACPDLVTEVIKMQEEYQYKDKIYSVTEIYEILDLYFDSDYTKKQILQEAGVNDHVFKKWLTLYGPTHPKYEQWLKEKEYLKQRRKQVSDVIAKHGDSDKDLAEIADKYDLDQNAVLQISKIREGHASKKSLNHSHDEASEFSNYYKLYDHRTREGEQFPSENYADFQANYLYFSGNIDRFENFIEPGIHKRIDVPNENTLGQRPRHYKK